MAYVGMDPTKSKSGESVASGKSMSKRAAADLRWALMQATDCVRRYDPYFGDYYANREGEDKKYHCLALAGVARKLMGVCLALMKEQRPWEPTAPSTRTSSGGGKVAFSTSESHLHSQRGARQHVYSLSHIHFSRFLSKILGLPLDFK
jgi:hypothetical protein